MQQTGREQLALTKAYEISYAVFRIAARVPSPAMKEHLERQALSLLDAAAVENYAWTTTVAKAIECLMRFGGDVGIIHERNTEMVVAELKAMNAAIAGLKKPVTLEPVHLDDIFGGQEQLFPENLANRKMASPVRQSKTGHRTTEPRTESQQESGNYQQEIGNQQKDDAPNAGSGVRQSAILERIRQSGNCRMKDIQEILPDLSERAIRYNLQSLVGQNLIEKVGVGGPGVFYRFRNWVPAGQVGQQVGKAGQEEQAGQSEEMKKQDGPAGSQVAQG